MQASRHVKTLARPHHWQANEILKSKADAHNLSFLRSDSEFQRNISFRNVNTESTRGMRMVRRIQSCIHTFSSNFRTERCMGLIPICYILVPLVGLRSLRHCQIIEGNGSPKLC